MYLLSYFVLALPAKYHREEIHTRQYRRALGAQYLLLQLQCPPVHFLSYLVLTLTVEHPREEDHAHQRIQVLVLALTIKQPSEEVHTHQRVWVPAWNSSCCYRCHATTYVVSDWDAKHTTVSQACTFSINHHFFPLDE